MYKSKIEEGNKYLSILNKAEKMNILQNCNDFGLKGPLNQIRFA